jgi:anti-sigma factor RsiW
MSIDDTDLLAYVDGQLPPERRAEVENAVVGSADLTARLRELRASVLPYAAAFEAQELPPVPEELGQRIANLVSVHGARQQRCLSSWPRLVAAYAAGVLCCAVALRLLLPQPPSLSSTAPIAPWIKAVADYQQLYSRATVANVSADPLLSARIITDLHTNDGMKVLVPDLSREGLSFKRVQRLSFHQRPVVQMVYLPEHGEPVALCVTPDVRADEAPHAQQVGELNTVSWRRGNLDYVLLGRGSSQALMDLGHRIASGDAPSLFGRTERASRARPA